MEKIVQGNYSHICYVGFQSNNLIFLTSATPNYIKNSKQFTSKTTDPSSITTEFSGKFYKPLNDNTYFTICIFPFIFKSTNVALIFEKDNNKLDNNNSAFLFSNPTKAFEEAVHAHLTNLLKKTRNIIFLST